MTKKKTTRRNASLGSAQGASAQPSSTPPEQSDTEIQLEVQSIPIGSPIDPEMLRGLKEVAATPEIPPPEETDSPEEAQADKAEPNNDDSDVEIDGDAAENQTDDANPDASNQSNQINSRRPNIMADNYSSGGSEPIAGKSRSLSELTVGEFINEFPPAAARPDWMVTRFPVSLDEYRALEAQARLPDLQRAASDLAAVGITVDVDSDTTGTTTVTTGDVPEGEMMQGPTGSGSLGSMAPGIQTNFAGIPQTAFQPPDNAIAVGPDHVLVAVNTDLAGYTKAGALLFRWPNMTSLFSPVLPIGVTIFDPQLAYDHYARRWIVVAVARRNSPVGSWIVIGVSQGADPAGAYWVWALDATRDGSNASNNWADFPMLGFDTQAIYISCNMFQFGGGFQYSKLRILNKAELYGGGVGPNHTIRWFDLWNLKNPDGGVAFTVTPAKHFRGTGGNPPAYLINSIWPSGNTLTMWTLTSPLALWSGGTPALSNASVNCRGYELPPDALQSGTTTRVDTGDVRVTQVVFQNVGGFQRLWAANTSKFTWSGDNEARSVVNWYEIDVPTKTVSQQGAFGASGKHYFYPCIQTDLGRNAYLLCARSGATEFAQLRQTGRKVSDTPNSLQGSALVAAGSAAYVGGRWGDYFGICRDGGDSSSVWMYGEHAGNGNTWATRVCKTKF